MNITLELLELCTLQYQTFGISTGFVSFILEKVMKPAALPQKLYIPKKSLIFFQLGVSKTSDLHLFLNRMCPILWSLGRGIFLLWRLGSSSVFGSEASRTRAVIASNPPPAPRSQSCNRHLCHHQLSTMSTNQLVQPQTNKQTTYVNQSFLVISKCQSLVIIVNRSDRNFQIVKQRLI